MASQSNGIILIDLPQKIPGQGSATNRKYDTTARSEGGPGATCSLLAETASLDGRTLQMMMAEEAESLLKMSKRSLSIGDTPSKSAKYSLPSLGKDASITEEEFLIGRASASIRNLYSNENDHCNKRCVRMTEVVPSNCNFDDEESWKLSIDQFSSLKHGRKSGDRKLPRRIRSYYKVQDELISAFESITFDDDNTDPITIAQAQIDLHKSTIWMARASVFVNFALLVAKAVAVSLSGSISIISSLVDSAVDLIAGLIIWWTSQAVKKRKPYIYPQGRTRLEPIAIVILSVVMSLAAIQLIVESIEKLVGLANLSADPPVVELPTILISGFTVVSKLLLYIACRCKGSHSPSILALAQDHRNDVVSNLAAITCGYLGSREFILVSGKQGVQYIDPIGAIAISIFILINWWKTGFHQIKLLTGHTAKPDFLSKLTWIAINHHQKVEQIDTVRAFHFGTNFLVELDIVLPGDMLLREAHDIGEDLQQKLEKLSDVERAFVHIDYEFTHNPNIEHKIV